MADQAISGGRVLHVRTDSRQAETVLKALASRPRLEVLKLLSDQVCNVGEIAESLNMPASTATLHISALEDAGLIKVDLRPAMRGLQKLCARAYDLIVVELPRSMETSEELIETAMPVGAYVDCQVTPTCGLADESSVISLIDDPRSFYDPGRIRAQLLWFRQGYVEYRFPNRLPQYATPDSLHLSLEICSEAPLHHENWPSDITLWINHKEIGAWTSPTDFGGQRGALTPAWWESWNSQYGLLKVWQVNGEGSFIDGIKISKVCLPDLRLIESDYISVRLGVKADARHIGGLNLFGRQFGNYPQDIMLRLRYH